MYYVDSLHTMNQMIRWLEILLQHFFFLWIIVARLLMGGYFPICVRVAYFFFERIHSTRPSFLCNLPLRPRIDAHMHMWG